ncbi:HTH_Tnp_Tc3_2 domain-containing protein [Trichonephila clavipes]|nr:HTH_Tnp_Tc3_2 domain-containing protein [Trichonephila clavipes]
MARIGIPFDSMVYGMYAVAADWKGVCSGAPSSVSHKQQRTGIKALDWPEWDSLRFIRQRHARSSCGRLSRPRVTTPNEDRYIYLAVTAKRNRRSTAPDLSCQLSLATSTTVSRQTVYRCLGHIGLYAPRLVRCVPLTTTQCRLRLTWSRGHALWTQQQWSCVMFSDDSRFSLQSDFRGTLIWRAPGSRYHQENTIERHRYGGAGWLARLGRSYSWFQN